MRTTTPEKRALLKGAHFHIHTRAFLADADDVMRPLHNLAGINWIDRAEWSDGVDQAVISGTITLRREARDSNGVVQSLSPLMSGSDLNRDSESNFAPQVSSFRRFEIHTATVAAGVVPGDEDFQCEFLALVDDPEFGGTAPKMEVSFRDIGARLLDAQIEKARIYSTDEGTPVEDVMQQILDDNGFSDVVLHTPVSPGWMIGQYRQETGSVLEALRALALQIGWDCRYRWIETTAGEEFVLTFYEPRRDTTTADTEFGPDEYLAVRSLKLGGAGVRNAGVLEYVDRATGQLKTAVYEHAGSIALYGRRFMRISEDASSNIDSHEEALAMITSAIEDLHIPLANQSIETLFCPFVVTGDVYDFLPNGIHYDETHRWGVVGWRHVLEGGSGRTTILTRGQPAGAYQRWIEAAGRGRSLTPGYFPNPEIGPIWGEDTAAGEGGDGAVWVRVRFDAGTASIRFYSETGENIPLPMPGQDANVLNMELARVEGDVASADDWETYIVIATTPGYWRKVLAVPVGHDAELGIPVVLEVQALSTHEPELEPVTDFSIQRSGDTNILTWTANVTESDAPVYYFIRRNGLIIAALEAPATSPEVMQFTDSGLMPNVPYDYQVFPWSDGVTGVFSEEEPPPAPPPVIVEPGDDPDEFLRPVWVIRPEWVLSGGIWTLHMEWTCAHPLATRIDIEHRPNPGLAWMLADSSASAASGSIQISGIVSAFWRLHARSATDQSLGVSDTAVLTAPPGGAEV